MTLDYTAPTCKKCHATMERRQQVGQWKCPVCGETKVDYRAWAMIVEPQHITLSPSTDLSGLYSGSPLLADISLVQKAVTSEQLDEKIGELEELLLNKMEDLKSIARGAGKEAQAKAEQATAELHAEVSELKTTLKQYKADVVEPAERISAEIQLPHIVTELVPAHLAYRLDEYRWETNLWTGFACVFLGGCLGALVPLALAATSVEVRTLLVVWAIEGISFLVLGGMAVWAHLKARAAQAEMGKQTKTTTIALAPRLSSPVPVSSQSPTPAATDHERASGEGTPGNNTNGPLQRE